MGGEEEGAPHPSPAPGDPRPHDVCRQVSRRGGGLAVLNLPGAFAGTFEMCQRHGSWPPARQGLFWKVIVS